MPITRFEDIETWQLSRELSLFVFKLSQEGEFEKDYKFRSQIRSSAGSIMDNIAEGFGRGGNKELINFLIISRGSCMETRSQSYRAYDFGYIDETNLNKLLDSTDVISSKLMAFINYLKNSDRKGPRYE